MPAGKLTEASSARAERWLATTFMLLSWVVCIGVRLRMLSFPLQRDEGEYAYMGQLMLQGIPPYALAYNVKLPGTYAAYAGLMALFGQTASGIHLGLALVDLGTAWFVYRLGLRILSHTGAAVAGAVFPVLALGTAVLGLSAHATHFVVAMAVPATLVLLRALERDSPARVCLAGVLFGLAVLMKQAGVFFGIFGGGWLVLCLLQRRPVPWKRTAALGGLFAAGALSPLVVTALALQAAGVFDRFWTWTVVYAADYASIVPLSEAWTVLRLRLPGVLSSAPLIWLLALLGLAGSWAEDGAKRRAAFLAGFTLFSLLAVCPGFYFRPHYWVLLLPALALGVGAAVSALASRVARVRTRWTGPLLGLGLALVAMAQALYHDRRVLFSLSPVAASRAVYGVNPFPESPAIADFIREHSSDTDRVGILGSEPQIPFLAHRHSASGHIYTYMLMEPTPLGRRLEREMIDEIERAAPLYLVVVGIRNSWLPRGDARPPIFTWIDRYTAAHYAQVGLVEILSLEETRYTWGDAARNAAPQTPYWVAVHRRRDRP